jgi:hypothetical protein
MEDGCVRYVAWSVVTGQADIRRRASIRSHQAGERPTDTNSRKEQRHGMGVMSGTVLPWHRITIFAIARKLARDSCT